ncbi:MAG TPA: RNA polymerase sigma factor [Ktedonobacterales bacterium]|jgi:RNA polymerase sigma-70 factor (ECF subfamily)|nr:RNA polymerase sigma factor [Ktedonobacterales bacterium]
MMTAYAAGEIRPTEESAEMPLANQLDELFSRAEPRLLRLARLQRIAPDAVDDVVQETLLEAWRSLEYLRDETRFAAWLDGICRNVCLRHRRKQGILQAHETAWESAGEETDLFAALADPESFDPTAELARHDMVVLLDCALGYLAPESRTLVEQHYLAEIPQRELAERMGLTLSALVARLHRARGQILHILSHELHAEATALGLAVVAQDAARWRETRIWCVFCGRQRMEGLFEPMADGRINMRLRCPGCSSFEIDSLGLVDLATARSFLPATKKIIGEIGHFFTAAMSARGTCRCWICGRPTELRVVREDGLSPQTGLLSTCGCLRIFASVPTLYGSLPAVREFLFGAGRVTIEPEVEAGYAGGPALRFGLLSPGDGRRLAVFADAETLLPRTVVVE